MDERCLQCVHFDEEQSEYHYCHVCEMEHDCFKKKESDDTQKNNLLNKTGCLMTDQEIILRCSWNIAWLEQEKVKLYQEYVDKIAAINRDIAWLQNRISNQLFDEEPNT